MYTVHIRYTCDFFNLQCTLNNSHYTLNIYSDIIHVQCAVYNVHCTAQCTHVHCTCVLEHSNYTHILCMNIIHVN